MSAVFHQMFAAPHERSAHPTSIEPAVITRVVSHPYAKLGLTLACASGTVLALYDDVETDQLLAHLGVASQTELASKHVRAHFLGRKLLGLSQA